MSKRDSTFHGILVVNKPGLQDLDGQRLPTSHDIVQMARRWSQQRRIGHTGTLDPMASGVLVLCMGMATRLVEYYQGHTKQYYAEITLGSATDTYDAMGEVDATSPVPTLDIPQIEAALDQFRGDILQKPPIYSALKQGGESLHRKARRGEAVTVKPRPITIHRLELVRFISPDKICLRINCAAGTYVRSLAHDIGIALNTHGHLTRLIRESAGAFSLAESHTLAQIETNFTQVQPASILQPLGYGLQMPTMILDKESIERFGYGQKVVLPHAPDSEMSKRIVYPNTTEGGTENGGLFVDIPDQLVQGIDSSGNFMGILRCLDSWLSPPAGALWKTEKWFGYYNKE